MSRPSEHPTLIPPIEVTITQTLAERPTIPPPFDLEAYARAAAADGVDDDFKALILANASEPPPSGDPLAKQRAVCVLLQAILPKARAA